MNKKILFKVIIFVILCAIAYVVFYFVKPFSGGNIMLSFSIEDNNNESLSYQVFYIDGNNSQYSDYNEEQKIDVILNSDNNYSASVELPYSVINMRIDEDPRSNTLLIDNLLLLYNGQPITLDDNTWYNVDIINDVEIISKSNNGMKLRIDGDDPYITWNLSTWNIDSYVMHRVRIVNYIIKISIIILLFIMYIVFIKHFDTLMEFPVEILYNRTLIFRLSLNDFKTRFAGSYLGIIWAFVQPIVTILLYWFVFEKAFHSSGVGEVPFALWMTSGLVPWFFFSEALMGGTSSLLEYQYLVKKVVFQIDILPVVKITSSLYVHMFFIVLTVIIFIFSGMPISVYWIQTLYYSLCAFVLTLGLAYITSAVTAFFRDLTQIINVLLTVGTWLTPIMWNYENAGLTGAIDIILRANPMFYIVQGYRDALVNHIWFWQRPALTLYFWIIAITIFCMGTVIYRRLKVHFADVL